MTTSQGYAIASERAEINSRNAIRCGDPASIPRREWLYDRHYIRKFVSATIAGGGVGKSALKLTEAVSMALGRDLLDGKRP